MLPGWELGLGSTLAGAHPAFATGAQAAKLSPIVMNTLSSLPAALLTPTAAATGSAGPIGPIGPICPISPIRQPVSWLDQGAQGQSEALHVGPNSRPRAIEDIEHDFVQALCQVDADKRL